MNGKPLSADQFWRLRQAFSLCVLLVSSGCGGGSGGGNSTAAMQPSAVQPLQPTYADVAYAQTSTQQRLDLYLPTRQAAPSPVVIYIHGGGFYVGDKLSIIGNNISSPAHAAVVPADGGPLVVSQLQVPSVAALTAKGYAVASINYRLGTSRQTAVEHAVQDAKAAARFLRANAARYNLDPDKFAAWGDSAGGTIASMLGASGDQATIFDDPTLGNAGVSSAVQAVVDWFGVIDETTIDAQTAAISVCAYLPVKPPFPTTQVGLMQQISPLTYIPTARFLPPFMIAHGDADCAVPAAQSKELYTALNRVHATATLTIVPGAGHEDPAFMATQMTPTFAFLDAAFGMTSH